MTTSMFAHQPGGPKRDRMLRWGDDGARNRRPGQMRPREPLPMRQPITGSPTVQTTSPTSERPGAQGSPQQFTLPSLTAAQLGSLSDRRREVDARFREAMARGQADRARLNATGMAAGNEIRRDFQRSTRDGMGRLAGRGTARNPRQGGRFLRDQRDAETGARNELAFGQAEQARALQMFLDDARRGRDEELNRLDADQVNMQADLGRLFPAAGWF